MQDIGVKEEDGVTVGTADKGKITAENTEVGEKEISDAVEEKIVTVFTLKMKKKKEPPWTLRRNTTLRTPKKINHYFIREATKNLLKSRWFLSAREKCQRQQSIKRNGRPMMLRVKKNRKRGECKKVKLLCVHSVYFDFRQVYSFY